MKRPLALALLLPWLACKPIGDGSEAGVDGTPDDAVVDGAPDATPDDGGTDASPVDGGTADGGDAGLCPPLPPDPDPDGLAYPGCRRDSFFIEFPLLDAPADAAEIDRIATLLESAARDMANADWWCAPGDQPCASDLRGNGLPDLRLEPLLPQRDGAWRSDGHLRFYRLWFQTPAGDRLTVRAEALCSFVSTLRDVGPERAYVGRECDVTVQSFISQVPACADARTWHLGRMGVEDGCAAPPPGDAGQGIRVALIDTGVDPAVAAAIQVEAGAGPDVPPGPVLHGHATAMALLIRQIAPNAAIVDYRVMDAQGVGVIGDVARALDTAIYSPDPADRLIINLSLGWPAALERPRALVGAGSCESWEDPAGTSVRYLLDAAGRQIPAPLIVTAAGNQPRAAKPDALPPPPPQPRADGCDAIAGPPAGPPHFYPGEWARRRTCRQGAAPIPRAGAMVVGAVDAADLRSVASPVASWPSLVAPGEHVYVDSPERPRAPGTQCPGAEQPCPEVALVESPLPAPVTGTSVAAALTAGAAARVWARFPDLDAQVLGRLLYLSGDLICGPDNRRPLSTSGVPVRRVHVDRAETLAQCMMWPAIQECLEDAADGSLEGPEAAVLACADLLGACNDMTHDFTAGWGGNDCGYPDFERPGWGGYRSQACSQQQVMVPPETGSLDCGGSCPFARVLDRHAAGAAGPQPDNPTCPDCALDLFETSPGEYGKFDLLLEINTELSAGTQFQNPYALIDSGNATAWIDLSTLTDLSLWKPGAAIVIAGIPTPASFPTDLSSWKVTKGELVVEVQPPAGTVWTSDTSSLRVLLP